MKVRKRTPNGVLFIGPDGFEMAPLKNPVANLKKR